MASRSLPHTVCVSHVEQRAQCSFNGRNDDTRDGCKRFNYRGGATKHTTPMWHSVAFATVRRIFPKG